MSQLRLIVGLGNPGREHEADRHNAGFWLVDALARRAGASFSREGRFFGELAKATVAGRPAWLLKPSTYMNRSGRAVAAVANFYRIAHDEILVAYDELDLMPGVAKIRKGGRATHNGLRDITASLGSPDYWRLKIGIGHPRSLQLEQQVVDFVLHAPRRDEQAAIDAEIARAVDVLETAIGGDIGAATMRLHTRPSPDPALAAPASRQD